MKEIRTLEYFEKDGDELAGEERLDQISLTELQSIFKQASDDQIDGYPVGEEEARLLQKYVQHLIDPDRYDYFVSLYAEDENADQDIGFSQSFDWPGFEYIEPEYSQVIDIKERQNVLGILLNASLEEGHPLYADPGPNERCYRQARIVFQNVQETHWTERIMTPIETPDGTTNYGRISAFWHVNGKYHLSGEWGVLEIISDPPRINILD